MITTKGGIKFSITLKDSTIKITPAIKEYFKECEKRVAKELDKMDFNPWSYQFLCGESDDGFCNSGDVTDKPMAVRKQAYKGSKVDFYGNL